MATNSSFSSSVSGWWKEQTKPFRAAHPAIKIGISESFGWHHEGSMFSSTGRTNQGFLGLKSSIPEFKKAREEAVKKFAGMGKHASRKAAFRYGVNKAGITGVGKLAGGTLMKALPLAFTGYMAYEGYKKEGVWGAAKGVAESAAWNIAPMILGQFSAPLIIGIGGYAIGEAANSRAKQLRDLEFGGGSIMESIGSMPAHTMRQRSVMALQNSHINGRMAMGNEAYYMHTSFR